MLLTARSWLPSCLAPSRVGRLMTGVWCHEMLSGVAKPAAVGNLLARHFCAPGTDAPPCATTAFLVLRLGCTLEEAEKAARMSAGRDGIGRLAESCDQLGYGYEGDIEPTLAHLQVRLGLSEVELKRVVLRLPTVLGLSYEGDIEPTLARLQARLGLSEVELKKVVLRLPTVLGLSYEGNIEFLRL
eukprot:SAG11_NODE_3606_length_2343_cov_2.716132_2_plen_186_part_00